MSLLHSRCGSRGATGTIATAALALIILYSSAHAQGTAAPPGSATRADDPGQPASTAGTAPASQGATAAPEPSAYDRIWANLTQLYRNDGNPIVQQIVFTGRYQHEFTAVGADQGSLEEWNVRRMRVGQRMTLFRRFMLHTELELNPQERDPFYMRVTDAYLQWNRSAAFVMTVGKQGVPFTLEGATSSKELLAIDRSNLTNNIWFPQEYLPGVSVAGRVAPWVYRGGMYSSGAMNREFGDFSGDYVALAVLGYDFANRLRVREATLAGNYVYQHPDTDNTFTRQLEHISSVNFKLEGARWGLRTDLAHARGSLEQSDLWATMVMPSFNLTPKLQAVGRYTYIDSADENGIRFATYESRLMPGRGDAYNELYLGANYYFYGHRLKLQSGVLWADMDDRAGDGGAYSGVSWTTGLRVGW